jgi:hypothetical protein
LAIRRRRGAHAVKQAVLAHVLDQFSEILRWLAIRLDPLKIGSTDFFMLP